MNLSTDVQKVVYTAQHLHSSLNASPPIKINEVEGTDETGTLPKVSRHALLVSLAHQVLRNTQYVKHIHHI